MGKLSSNNDCLRLKMELGIQRWEAIGHYLSDGDYLGFNRSDFRGAIAEYEKAWELLNTAWQRQVGGTDILEGIAEFALRSGDPDLVNDALVSLRPRAEQFSTTSLQVACGKLALILAEREVD